ncbi:copper transpport protein [Friedmanniomyces endolithicus]|nr:copper transpport protein [Friedmanniomyces endolithicus]
MSHGDMDMGPPDSPMCSMNMLFTWDTNNLCIVFRSWRITSTTSLIVSLLGVMALTAGYEAVREASRRYEQRHAAIMEGAPRESTPSPKKLTCVTAAVLGLIAVVQGGGDERRSLLWATGSSAQAEEQKGKVVKAALYGVQVFYSFFIMLLFMTYNGWIMLAVGFGAFVGYLMFGGSSIVKSAACH